MRVCVRRLCVCDMDRLGRNEFIGEVRVALKKLREGENKRYNMGLERITQVGTLYMFHIPNGFLWTYTSRCVLFPLCMFAWGLSVINFKHCIIICHRYSPGGSLCYNHYAYLSHFRIKKLTINQWSRERSWQKRR